jgi:hypothetical protein
LVIAAVCVIGTQEQFDWLPLDSATAEGLDWTSVRDDLSARGLLRPGTVVGVPNWRDAGKIAHALGSDVPVICLNEDSRQFGFAAPPERWAGADVLLLIVDHADTIVPTLRGLFAHIDIQAPTTVTLRGHVLKTITVATGTKFAPPKW